MPNLDGIGDIIDYSPTIPYDRGEILSNIERIEKESQDSPQKTQLLERLNNILKYLETRELPKLKLSE
jgi:hypothetical protein